MQSSLRNFDPEIVALLDLHMWQAYYKQNFFRLFVLIVKLSRTQFHLAFINSLLAAYYAASAAMLFRFHRGKENKEKIIKKLIPFYKIILKNNVEIFDYQKAARLELNWWFIDRYPTQYKITREEGLAEAMAILYSIPRIKLEEYAKNRADAMVLEDVAKTGQKETDWNQIEILLKKSYISLHEAVNT